MDRRTFIGSMAAIGCAGIINEAEASPVVKLAVKTGKIRKGGVDDNLVVLITDVHVKLDGWQPGIFRKRVEEILALDPLPHNIIVLGDLAFHTGKVEEYKLLKELIKPIEDAGIKLTLAMGNHDRREEFASVFPERASDSLMDGRYVYKVETPKVDFVVLDSLQQGEDKTKWITPGALDEEQKSLLQRILDDSNKPLFVCSHHPVSELGIEKLLTGCPNCCGYLYGHNHHWRKDWIKYGWHDRRIMRTLCIPSTGHCGDIGFVSMRMEDDCAVATLHEMDFFFPEPIKEGEPVPTQWKVMLEENQGDKCTFTYESILRKV